MTQVSDSQQTHSHTWKETLSFLFTTSPAANELCNWLTHSIYLSFSLCCPTHSPPSTTTTDAAGTCHHHELLRRHVPVRDLHIAISCHDAGFGSQMLGHPRSLIRRRGESVERCIALQWPRNHQQESRTILVEKLQPPSQIYIIIIYCELIPRRLRASWRLLCNVKNRGFKEDFLLYRKYFLLISRILLVWYILRQYILYSFNFYLQSPGLTFHGMKLQYGISRYSLNIPVLYYYIIFIIKLILIVLWFHG